MCRSGEGRFLLSCSRANPVALRFVIPSQTCYFPTFVLRQRTFCRYCPKLVCNWFSPLWPSPTTNWTWWFYHSAKHFPLQGYQAAWLAPSRPTCLLSSLASWRSSQSLYRQVSSVRLPMPAWLRHNLSSPETWLGSSFDSFSRLLGLGPSQASWWWAALSLTLCYQVPLSAAW